MPSDPDEQDERLPWERAQDDIELARFERRERARVADMELERLRKLYTWDRVRPSVIGLPDLSAGRRRPSEPGALGDPRGHRRRDRPGGARLAGTVATPPGRAPHAVR